MAVVRVRRMEGRKKVRRCMVMVVVMELQPVYPLEPIAGNAENGKLR